MNNDVNDTVSASFYVFVLTSEGLSIPSVNYYCNTGMFSAYQLCECVMFINSFTFMFSFYKKIIFC